MIEPEIAFCDLNLNMKIAENMVKAVIEVQLLTSGWVANSFFLLCQAVLETCEEDMAFFDKWVCEGLVQRLKKTLDGTGNEILLRKD